MYPLLTYCNDVADSNVGVSRFLLLGTKLVPLIPLIAV